MIRRADSNPRRAARPWVAVLALLFGVGNLAGLIHASTEQHARCAEHGELIHAVSDAKEVLVTADAEPIGTVRSTAIEDGHEHCSLLLCSRDALESETLENGKRVEIVSTDHAHLSARLADSRILLSLAPKTSPPA